MIYIYPDLIVTCSNIKVKKLPNLNTLDVVCAGKQDYQCSTCDSEDRAYQVFLPDHLPLAK